MKNVIRIFIVLIFVCTLLLYINNKVSLGNGKGWVIGKVDLVNYEGNSFTVTIEKVKGYYNNYSESYVTFNKYDFTQIEDKAGNPIPYTSEINEGENVKVFHEFINGHMVVVKIQKQ